MDYDNIYRDLEKMAQEASHRAAMWFEYDQGHAMRLLEFAAECESFRSGIFIRGYGGY